VDMSVQLLLERFFGVTYLVLGLSYLTWAPRWVAIYRRALEKPDLAMVLGAIPLAMGALLVAGHNVWGLSIPGLITLIGWLALIKGFLFLVAPDWAAAVMRRFPVGMPLVFFGGAFATLVGLLAILHSFVLVYRS